MFNLDTVAKGAKEGLQKMGVDPAEAAKTALQGLQNTEAASEQVMTVLRNLLAEAKKINASTGGNNEALNTCIQKAEALLEQGDSSVAAITKVTAELTALIKGASGEKQAEPTGGKSVGFSDVDANAYYYDAVQWAVQKGITSGTSETTFGPDETCTRAQTIVFLWRAVGSPAPKGSDNPFSDVNETSFYYKAVLWAAERGIISGNTFDPDAAVTRAQVATFLYREAGSPAVKGGAAFADVPADAYFAQPVVWVAEKGITSGVGENTFQPDGKCTRGQIVTFLYRAKK